MAGKTPILRPLPPEPTCSRSSSAWRSPAGAAATPSVSPAPRGPAVSPETACWPRWASQACTPRPWGGRKHDHVTSCSAGRRILPCLHAFFFFSWVISSAGSSLRFRLFSSCGELSLLTNRSVLRASHLVARLYGASAVGLRSCDTRA